MPNSECLEEAEPDAAIPSRGFLAPEATMSGSPSSSPSSSEASEPTLITLRFAVDEEAEGGGKDSELPLYFGLPAALEGAGSLAASDVDFGGGSSEVRREDEAAGAGGSTGVVSSSSESLP